jgi:ABC-type branched-subunit amino acid transport system substrate-binding protein
MRRILAVLGALAVGGALAGCSGSDHDETTAVKVKKPAPVQLAVDTDKTAPVKVGVVWTKTGEGSQWRLGASGAEVAAYRYSALGHSDVSIVAAEDKGTEAGAADAVGRLVDEGVSGIVVATSGTHVSGALTAARDAGVPVLLPYDTTTTLADGAWRTGPSSEQALAAVRDALAGAHAQHPAVVVSDGHSAEGLDAAIPPIAYDGDDLDGVVKALTKASDRQRIDSVVVWGGAESDARLTDALEAALPSTPIVLSPDATAGAFDVAYGASGLVAPSLYTVGTDTSDPAALAADGSGDSAAAYFSAVRLAAGSEDTTSLSGGPLSEVADYVDIASHDAVVAIVDAVAEAGSSDPDAVGEALAGLHLDASDGLAGPPLDFTSSDALPDDAVVPLQATSQDPGLRPAVATQGRTKAPRVYWFAAPTAG